MTLFSLKLLDFIINIRKFMDINNKISNWWLLKIGNLNGYIIRLYITNNSYWNDQFLFVCKHLTTKCMKKCN